MIAAIVTGLGDGALLALSAIGIVLVFKGSRVLNLAQGEIGLFALFVTYVLFGKASAPPALLLVGTIVVAALLGIGVERVLMRPLVERPPIQSTIVTLGLAVVLINLEVALGSPSMPITFLEPGAATYPTGVPAPLGGGARQFLGATIQDARFVALLLTAAVGVGLYTFFKRTKFGMGVIAATSDNTVARLLGIPVRKVYRFTWGVGGALSGTAAVIVADLSAVKPGDMTLRMIAALAAAVIGGLDSVLGAIAGGLIIGVATGLVQFQTGSAGLADFMVLVLVVGTLLIRPRGLFGGVSADA